MNGEIDRKILYAAMLRLGTVFLSSLCALDTVVRIEDDDDKLYACRNCVFRNVISMLVCPNEIKEDIEKLRLK